MTINVNNPPKLYGILLAMVLLSICLIAGKLSEAAYFGMMGTMLGYLVGNGVAARNGDPVQAVLGKREE